MAMRLFEEADMKPGLKIHVPQRHMIYQVDAINDDRVSYTTYQGGCKHYTNEMNIDVFVPGMTERFAMVEQ